MKPLLRRVMNPPSRAIALAALTAICVWSVGEARTRQQPDWPAVEAETLRHYQAVLRLDTSNPPGNESLVAEYAKAVFDKEGIPAQLFALDAKRANVVARLKGGGRKRPLLIMSHMDVVTTDPAKWRFPPFSATRDGGYVYARGATDDKDNFTAGLMTMALLKRLRVPLDRDVIFLGEAGEEGSTRVGIQFMVDQHFDALDAEYCLAEGGGVARIGGQVKYASVQTLEKTPRTMELIARGASGHGSVPLKSNAIAHLAAAVARVNARQPDVRLNATTSAYFQRLAGISTPDMAAQYRGVLSSDQRTRAAADEWLFEHEPRHASMLRTSISPNIIAGGYRSNVIPSQAQATLDVRALPDEDPTALLEWVRKAVNDPAVEVRYAEQDIRPRGVDPRLDSEAFAAIESAVKRIYKAVTLPTMSTGATDMSYLRARGVQCYGIGPATDVEDGPLGFGAHSDQERLLESELHRFVRFNWDVISNLAQAH